METTAQATIRSPIYPDEITEEELAFFENFPLLESDGTPMESPWHRDETNLLIESVLYHFQDRDDFYVGGNMFVYYDMEQASKLNYRGPDFFFVKESHLTPQRLYWVVWKEGGRYPNVIIELLSPSTAREDRTNKKDLYERTFRTPEYFLYDNRTQLLNGWRLGKDLRYEPISANERGWLWSQELGLWLGPWTGEYLRTPDTWLRFYDAQGQLVLLKAERALLLAESEKQRAESEKQRAESEKQRAAAAEAELTRLNAWLAQQGITPPESS